MQRVEIVMPDAGPLISLAMGEALDVLLKLELPIRIVDQVFYEVTKSDGYPGAIEVRAFAEAYPDRLLIAPTNVGRLAALERKQDPGAKQRGLGDAAIAEFMSRIDEFIYPGAPILLVYEDGDINAIRITHSRQVHLIGTRELLTAMERENMIPSASDIMDRILAKGRIPSRTTSEQPAETEFGRTFWVPPRG